MTDLIGEAAYIESRALLTEIASKRATDPSRDGSDLFGQPIGKISTQIEARIVARYIALQKQYAAQSLEEAKVLENRLTQPSG